MLSRIMYKPHISCLQKDIVTQNGITLTTDSEINKILLNGAEVYCIDTSKCYLYDEENKTLIEKSEINDILVDGEITPESVTLINNKVNNFIAEINDKIAQADIDKVVELANELDVLTDNISEINSSLNAKANLASPNFTGIPTINNKDIVNGYDIISLPYFDGIKDSDINWKSTLYRQGNFIVCVINVKRTDNSNFINGTEYQIATLPEGWKAPNLIFTVKQGWGNITFNNKLNVTPTVDTTDLNASFIYTKI